MTNNTTHESTLLQAPGYKPVLSVTNYGNGLFAKEAGYHVNVAALKLIGEWFEYLKEKKVYDNTRIILVSDHGPQSNFVVKVGHPTKVDQFNPLLMVKDFYASGKIMTDMEFMTNADVPYLALLDLIDNPTNPFTGNNITLENKKNPLYIAISASIHISDPSETQIRLNPKLDYYVSKNIFDPNNWKKAEE
jgi:hypothetical protein